MIVQTKQDFTFSYLAAYLYIKIVLLSYGLASKLIYPVKSSAQVGVWVNSVLTRNGYIKFYISLSIEIILQQRDAFQTEIQDSLKKLCALKRLGVTPQKW